MDLKLKENFPNGFQRKLSCHSHQEKYFCSLKVKVNSKLFWLETAYGQALPLFWVSFELSRTRATYAELTQPGGVGVLGFSFQCETSGLGEEWPDKKVWLRSSVQETKFIWGDHSRKWNFKCSSLIHFSLFHISFPTKTSSPPLKIWVRRLKRHLAKLPCMYFWQTVPFEEGFLLQQHPTAGQSCCFPTALQQQGHKQHTRFYSVSLPERYQISHISLKTEAPYLCYPARRTREICLLYTIITIYITIYIHIYKTYYIL